MVDRLAGRVRELIAPRIADAGADLEDVEISAAGRRRVVRVLVDTDSGIGMDQIAELTRVVSAALDDGDVMGERSYLLEVSSPGVTRPLTLPRHWRRNRGRLVRVALHSANDPVVGRIDDTTEDSATLLIADEHRTIALADVRRAVVQVEMDAKER